ncbi:hypothetical protein EVAR_57510_1 [Eumeta japonica]|uniref:Uncharacterized protein n=1 Tax=Eumeta variegata TaxID=151549 RepID=A0A4C1ZG06_EUMVA|nr:hypothetical protein EVAR_57510_1 [Eumeta japonica]
MGLRRLITGSMATFWLHHQTLDLPYSIQSTRQGIKSNEPKLDGVASFNYGVPGHLPAPSSDADYHIVSKYSSRTESNEPKLDGYQSTRQDESNEPKLDGVASFNYGVPMATFRLHHQTLLPYSIKYSSEESNEPKLDRVLVKTNQTSPNSMGLRRLITEFLWPSSIIRPWLPYSIKVLVRNQTSPNSMGLRRLITEFLWPPSAPSSDLRLPYNRSTRQRQIKRAQTRWGCVV